MNRVALLLLAALLAGCAASAGDQRRNASEAVRVGAALEEVPGVRDAEVVHLLDPSTPGVARVTVVVDPRTPTQAAQEAVLEAVWRSRLEPLAGFRLQVQEPDGSYRSAIDPVRFAELEDELVRRFGPRPVPQR